MNEFMISRKIYIYKKEYRIYRIYGIYKIYRIKVNNKKFSIDIKVNYVFFQLDRIFGLSRFFFFWTFFSSSDFKLLK